MQQQNLDSTKTPQIPLSLPSTNSPNVSPIHKPKNNPTNELLCAVVEKKDISRSYLDQTRHFLIQSSRGNN